MTVEISAVIDMIKKQSLLMARQEELEPTFFFVNEEEIGVCPLDFKDAESKTKVALAIPRILKEKNASSYAMISETWQAKLEPNDPKVSFLLSGEIRVSDLPMDDREELISLIVVENHKNVRYYTAMIKSFNYPRVVDEFVEQKSEVLIGKFLVKDW